MTLKCIESNYVQHLDDETVIHITTSGKNIFLNKSAGTIYDFIGNGISLTDLLKKLVSHYSIDVMSIMADIEKTLDILISDPAVKVD